MGRGTRWVWIGEGDERVLAFTYFDRALGPSAKGRIVGRDPTPEQIRSAIDRPDRTYRQPEHFGVVVIAAQEALALGLPKDPPWIGHFEDKPVPPPRGEDSRTVTAIVHQDGAPVADARVRVGLVTGSVRELVKLDERRTDSDGRCEFPLVPMRPVAALALADGHSSKLVDVPESNVVRLELLTPGGLEGRILRAGQPVRGQVSMIGRDGGVHRVCRSEPDGRYRLRGVVPGRYDVEVNGIDPRNHMTAGTPTYGELEIISGVTLLRDYTLLAGVTIDVAAAVSSKDQFGNVFLLAGAVAPRTAPKLRELYAKLDRTQRRSANSSTNDGQFMRTRFADVVPGTYTVCVTPWDRRGEGIADQPVVTQTVVVDDQPIAVELTVPALILP